MMLDNMIGLPLVSSLYHRALFKFLLSLLRKPLSFAPNIFDLIYDSTKPIVYAYSSRDDLPRTWQLSAALGVLNGR